ncbi:LCP family protein [Laceyella putida]|uniref:LCP family protein n=1 Tax=Laceyella putida TaxID=110101 RepID=A0ABW2RGE7_9BACL
MRKDKQAPSPTKRRRWIWRFVIMIFLIIAGVGSYFSTQLWGAFAHSSKPLKKSTWRAERIVIEEKDPFTVLLIGTDQRSTDPNNWRPDVLILAAVNPKTNTIKLLSIPRDTYVKIANTDVRTKINAAAMYGRITGVGEVENIRQTIENIFHVPIDYYAQVNFQGFENLVDALGGVDVNVKQRFTQQAIGGEMITFEPGRHHLNGSEALAYVRNRKAFAEGDFARNERQREVISQLIDKMTGIDGVTKFNKITNALGGNFDHSFQFQEIPSLIKTYQEIPKEKIETITFEAYPKMYKRSGWVVIIPDEEIERISRILHQQLEYKPQDVMIDKANGNEADSAPARSPEKSDGQ